MGPQRELPPFSFHFLTRRFLHFPIPAIPPPPFMALHMFSDRGRGGGEVWYRCQAFVSSFPSLRATHEISPFFPSIRYASCVYTVQHAPSLFSPGKPGGALGHLEEEGRKEGGILNLGDRGPPGAAGIGKREKKVGSLFSPPPSFFSLYSPPSASVSSPGNKGLLHPS